MHIHFLVDKNNIEKGIFRGRPLLGVFALMLQHFRNVVAELCATNDAGSSLL